MDADRAAAAPVEHGRRLPEDPDEHGRVVGAGLAVIDLHALTGDVQHDLLAGWELDGQRDLWRLAAGARRHRGAGDEGRAEQGKKPQ